MCVVDESDDDEPVWLISTRLDCSVRSENCEVLHLNSNMVAASLKQSGLVTDRAYSHLTSDERSLTFNALVFLTLLVQRRSGCYKLFVEAAQALCNRAMEPGKGLSLTAQAVKADKNIPQSRRRHVGNISEQNSETAKQQEQSTSAEDDRDSPENADLTNGEDETDSFYQQGLEIFRFYVLSFPLFKLLMLFYIQLWHSGHCLKW